MAYLFNTICGIFGFLTTNRKTCQKEMFCFVSLVTVVGLSCWFILVSKALRWLVIDRKMRKNLLILSNLQHMIEWGHLAWENNTLYNGCVLMKNRRKVASVTGTYWGIDRNLYRRMVISELVNLVNLIVAATALIRALVQFVEVLKSLFKR